jgi:hypothetical protein
MSKKMSKKTKMQGMKKLLSEIIDEKLESFKKQLLSDLNDMNFIKRDQPFTITFTEAYIPQKRKRQNQAIALLFQKYPNTSFPKPISAGFFQFSAKQKLDRKTRYNGMIKRLKEHKALIGDKLPIEDLEITDDPENLVVSWNCPEFDIDKKTKKKIFNGKLASGKSKDGRKRYKGTNYDAELWRKLSQKERNEWRTKAYNGKKKRYAKFMKWKEDYPEEYEFYKKHGGKNDVMPRLKKSERSRSSGGSRSYSSKKRKKGTNKRKNTKKSSNDDALENLIEEDMPDENIEGMDIEDIEGEEYNEEIEEMDQDTDLNLGPEVEDIDL